MINQLYINKNSNKIVIIFSSLAVTVKQQKDYFEFYGFSHSDDYNTLFLSDTRWNENGGFWYLSSNVVDVCENYCSVQSITEVYTFGASMGGYAALFVGCKLNKCKKCFLLSPNVNVFSSFLNARAHIFSSDVFRNQSLVSEIYDVHDLLKQRTDLEVYAYVAKHNLFDMENIHEISMLHNVLVHLVEHNDHVWFIFEPYKSKYLKQIKDLIKITSLN